MMLLWKSAGTGHYGYSGEIPVAVVRPLAAIEGPWTWTLLVGPPTVLQAFEAAGERPSRSRAQNKAEEAWRRWCERLLSLRLKEKRHVTWSGRSCLAESGRLSRKRPALSIGVMLCATTGSFSMSRMRIEPPVHGVTLQRRGKAVVKAQPHAHSHEQQALLGSA